MRERGRALENEDLLFAVIEEQRALVDAASSRTREARRFSERLDRALDGVGAYEAEDADLEPRESENVLRDHPGLRLRRGRD